MCDVSEAGGVGWGVGGQQVSQGEPQGSRLIMNSKCMGAAHRSSLVSLRGAWNFQLSTRIHLTPKSHPPGSSAEGCGHHDAPYHS